MIPSNPEYRVPDSDRLIQVWFTINARVEELPFRFIRCLEEELIIGGNVPCLATFFPVVVAAFLTRSDVPRSTPLIYWAIALIMIGGSRY